MLGALGGITNVIMLLFSGFIGPINEHSFVLKAANKLYFARTKENTIFLNQPDPKGRIETKSKSTKRELGYHRVIMVKKIDNFLLYLTHRLGSCGCMLKLCWKRQRKFNKLYKETQNRLKSSLNVIKIIRSLRDLKILMNNSLLNPELKNYLRHAEKNLIDLEDTSQIQDEFEYENSESQEAEVEDVQISMLSK